MEEDRVIEFFYRKLQTDFPLDIDVRDVWKEVKKYVSDNKEYFPTEESKFMWLLNEMIEKYNMNVYEVDALHWTFDSVYQNCRKQPPNG